VHSGLAKLGQPVVGTRAMRNERYRPGYWTPEMSALGHEFVLFNGSPALCVVII
jgi:hypothetical protein